jgi:hypothetical protein
VEKGAKKPKYEFTIPGQEPFGIAAVWKIWKNPGTNQWEKTFAVLTGEPNEVMKPIHNRMTTFLKPRDYEEYLASTERPLLHLLRSRLVSSTVVERLENPGFPRIWPGKSLRRVPVRMIDQVAVLVCIRLETCQEHGSGSLRPIERKPIESALWGRRCCC